MTKLKPSFIGTAIAAGALLFAAASLATPAFAAAGTTDASAWTGLAVLAGFVAAYILPSMIASWRGHHNTAAIVILNIFLGWTFIGWVICLAWAFTAVMRPRAC